MEKIVYILHTVQKQIFVEMSIAVVGVGPAASMSVLRFVVDVEIIHVKRQRSRHLYVSIVARKIKKPVALTSIIISLKRQMRRPRLHVLSQEKEYVLVRKSYRHWMKSCHHYFFRGNRYRIFAIHMQKR